MTGIENLRPGLGERVSESLRAAGNAPRGNPTLLQRLGEVGARIRPQVPFIYDARGRLERLFDGSR
ncbi:MAG: hypothetical protein ABII00_12575 [Elusimicrobiota bacterium]